MTAAAAPQLQPPPPRTPRLPRAVQNVGSAVFEPGLHDLCQRRFGDVFALWAWPFKPLVMVAHPDEAKRIFTAPATSLHAGGGNVLLQPVVGGKSVLLLDEDDHMRERKRLLPHFHRDALQRQRGLMEDVAAAELAEWPVDRAFAVFPFTQRLTLRIIVRVVFGMTGETGRRMEDAIRRLAPGAWPLVFPQLRRLPGDGAPWRRFLRARADMDALIREELRRRVVGGDAGDADVMSLLLRAYAEQDEALDPQLVRDELVTLLIAGHETTGSGLAWTFERLSRHPDAVAKARAGLEGGDESYTDNVVRETLRSRPPLRMCVRRVREPTEVGGFRVEPGASLGLGIALIHHRPDLYPEPERFRPERFAEGAPETYSWIPFGGGVRRCLGAAFASQEMKVVIGQALRRFDIVADPRPGERLRRRAITWIPHRGGEIRLRLRAG